VIHEVLGRCDGAHDLHIALVHFYQSQQGNYCIQAPNVIRDARFQRWRHAQRLMNPAEIAVHVMERDRMLKVFHLLRGSVWSIA
jgi:hypothetical protein